MNSKAEILSELPGRLDLAVLEKDGDGGFEIHGKVPEWLEAIFKSVHRPEEHSLFLADFLKQGAQDAWSGDAGEPVRSGIWEEAGPDGDPHHFEAIAMKVDKASVLIIELADERHDREQMFVQQMHDDTLDSRRLGKEIEKKEILLDCIVHDLSNPLATMMVSLQHLSRKIGDHRLQKPIQRAISQAKRQRSLIRSIAQVFQPDLSAFDPVSLRGENAPDILAVSREILDAHSETAAEREIELDLENRLPDDPGDTHRVTGEIDHLGRVIENLLANAIRHSPDRGRIKVILENEPDRVATVLRVEDEGPGVDPEIAETLFKPFIQGRESTGQSGLGLYFCKMMIELWGGDIGYRPRPEGGACFWFRLPALTGPEMM